MNASVWIHPTTGAKRVYINNFGATKVWVEAQTVDSFGFDYTIRAKNDNKNRSEIGNIINDAEQLIFVAANARVKSFEEVLALV